MENRLNKASIEQLITVYSNDKEMLDMIFNALSDFEDYHRRIYEMETKLKDYLASMNFVHNMLISLNGNIPFCGQLPLGRMQ